MNELALIDEDLSNIEPIIADGRDKMKEFISIQGLKEIRQHMI